MFRCRNKDCKCLLKRDWKCEDLFIDENEQQCENKFCRCQQLHEWKCVDIWLNKNKWQCQHDRKCKTERECQRDYLCLNECRSEEYTQELLEDYLKNISNEQQYEFFRKYCKECGKMFQISSFHLHTSQEKALYVG